MEGDAGALCFLSHHAAVFSTNCVCLRARQPGFIDVMQLSG